MTKTMKAVAFAGLLGCTALACSAGTPGSAPPIEGTQSGEAVAVRLQGGVFHVSVGDSEVTAYQTGTFSHYSYSVAGKTVATVTNDGTTIQLDTPAFHRTLDVSSELRTRVAAQDPSVVDSVNASLAFSPEEAAALAPIAHIHAQLAAKNDVIVTQLKGLGVDPSQQNYTWAQFGACLVGGGGAAYVFGPAVAGGYIAVCAIVAAMG